MCTLNVFLPALYPFLSFSTTSGSPAAASSVGSMSVCEKISLETVPALSTPGQRIAHGTRQPPSQFVSFSPRNGVMPPSGQLHVSAPLSVEYMTMVFSTMLRSSSFFSNCPTCPSCSTMPSGYVPSPVLPCDSFLRCVKTCMRVEFHHTKKGFSSLTALSMNLRLASRNSSSTVSMRLVVSGPVFSIFCVPSGFAQQCNTPRGPYFFLNSGSLG